MDDGIEFDGGDDDLYSDEHINPPQDLCYDSIEEVDDRNLEGLELAPLELARAFSKRGKIIEALEDKIDEWEFYSTTTIERLKDEIDRLLAIIQRKESRRIGDKRATAREVIRRYNAHFSGQLPILFFCVCKSGNLFNTFRQILQRAGASTTGPGILYYSFKDNITKRTTVPRTLQIRNKAPTSVASNILWSINKRHWRQSFRNSQSIYNFEIRQLVQQVESLRNHFHLPELYDYGLYQHTRQVRASRGNALILVCSTAADLEQWRALRSRILSLGEAECDLREIRERRSAERFYNIRLFTFDSSKAIKRDAAKYVDQGWSLIPLHPRTDLCRPFVMDDSAEDEEGVTRMTCSTTFQKSNCIVLTS